MSGMIGGGGGVASTHDHSGSAQGPNLAQSVVTGLAAALSGKAASSHAHVPADVAGFDAAVEAAMAGDAVEVDGNLYYYKRLLTLDNTGLPAVAGAQVKLSFSSSNFIFSRAASDGADLRFTDAEGTLLPYFISEWNPTTKVGTVFVKADLPNSASLAVWMYYGATGATAASTASIFDATITPTLIAAWDMDETTGNSIADATGNGHTGTAVNASIVDGKVGKTRDCQATNNSGFTVTQIALAQPYSIGFWMKWEQKSRWHPAGFFTDDSHQIKILGDPSQFSVSGSSEFGAGFGAGQAGWHHIAFSFHDGKPDLYIDGVFSATTGDNRDLGFIDKIGYNGKSQGDFGFPIMDQIRVYDGALSAQQIALLAAANGFVSSATKREYLYKDSASVVTVGTETELAPAPWSNPLTTEGDRVKGGTDGAFERQPLADWQADVRTAVGASALIQASAVDQTIGASWTAINMGTKVFDTGAFWDAGSPNIFTIPVTGHYLIGVFAPTSAGTSRNIGIAIDGVTGRNTGAMGPAMQSGAFSAMYSLTAGQAVALTGYGVTVDNDGSMGPAQLWITRVH